MIKPMLALIHTELFTLPADLRNIVHFRINAPKRFQTIYIDSRDVEYPIAHFAFYKSAGMSGRVLDGDWDQKGHATVDSWISTIIRRRIRLNYS